MGEPSPSYFSAVWGERGCVGAHRLKGTDLQATGQRLHLPTGHCEGPRPSCQCAMEPGAGLDLVPRWSFLAQSQPQCLPHVEGCSAEGPGARGRPHSSKEAAADAARSTGQSLSRKGSCHAPWHSVTHPDPCGIRHRKGPHTLHPLQHPGGESCSDHHQAPHGDSQAGTHPLVGSA